MPYGRQKRTKGGAFGSLCSQPPALHAVGVAAPSLQPSHEHAQPRSALDLPGPLMPARRIVWLAGIALMSGSVPGAANNARHNRSHMAAVCRGAGVAQPARSRKGSAGEQGDRWRGAGTDQKKWCSASAPLFKPCHGHLNNPWRAGVCQGLLNHRGATRHSQWRK